MVNELTDAVIALEAVRDKVVGSKRWFEKEDEIKEVAKELVDNYVVDCTGAELFNKLLNIILED